MAGRVGSHLLSCLQSTTHNTCTSLRVGTLLTLLLASATFAYSTRRDDSSNRHRSCILPEPTTRNLFTHNPTARYDTIRYNTIQYDTPACHKMAPPPRTRSALSRRAPCPPSCEFTRSRSPRCSSANPAPSNTTPSPLPLRVIWETDRRKMT